MGRKPVDAFGGVFHEAGIHDRIGASFVTFTNARNPMIGARFVTFTNARNPIVLPKRFAVIGVIKPGTEGNKGKQPVPMRLLRWGRRGVDKHVRRVALIEIGEEGGVGRTVDTLSAEGNDNVFHGATRDRLNKGNPKECAMTPRTPWMLFEGVHHIEPIWLTLDGESAKGSLGALNGNAVIAEAIPIALFCPEVSLNPGCAIRDTTVSGFFARVGKAKGQVDARLPLIGGNESNTFVIGVSEDAIFVGIKINNFQRVLEKTWRDGIVKKDCRSGAIAVPRDKRPHGEGKGGDGEKQEKKNDQKGGGRIKESMTERVRVGGDGE